MFIDIFEERRLLDAKTTLIDEVDYIVNDWHDNKYKGVILYAYASHTSCHVSISNTNCEMEIVVPS
jgi:hypothetical protein